MLAGCVTGPTFTNGQTTLDQMKQMLGEPEDQISLPNGLTRVRWPRTTFHGVTATGEAVNQPETFYDAEFGADHILKDWRAVDTSIPLKSDLLFPNPKTN